MQQILIHKLQILISGKQFLKIGENVVTFTHLIYKMNQYGLGKERQNVVLDGNIQANVLILYKIDKQKYHGEILYIKNIQMVQIS